MQNAAPYTDFALLGDPQSAKMAAERDMNDYRYIRLSNGFRRIRPFDTAYIHANHRAWLEEQLGVPFAEKTVVVSHHCSHPDLVGELPSDLDAVYGSNLLPLIERYQPDAWMHGHTHWRIEAMVGRTLVRDLSLAYPDSVPAREE